MNFKKVGIIGVLILCMISLIVVFTSKSLRSKLDKKFGPKCTGKYSNNSLNFRPGAENNTLELAFFSAKKNMDITFHPKKKFYLLESDSTYYKVSDQGVLLFTLPKTTTRKRIPFTSYIYTKNGIIDFSSPTPHLEPFINDNEKKLLAETKYKEMVFQSYKHIEVLVLVNDVDRLGKTQKCSIIKWDNKWYFLPLQLNLKHLLSNLTKTLLTPSGDIKKTQDKLFRKQYKLDIYPEKFEKMAVLKNKEYDWYTASWEKYNDRVRYFKKSKFVYGKGAQVKLAHYKNLAELDRNIFTSNWLSKAFYTLTVRGTTFHFNTQVIRSSYEPMHEGFAVYLLPDKFENKVFFIEHYIPNIFGEYTCSGIYMLRKKHTETDTQLNEPPVN